MWGFYDNDLFPENTIPNDVGAISLSQKQAMGGLEIVYNKNHV